MGKAGGQPDGDPHHRQIVDNIVLLLAAGKRSKAGDELTLAIACIGARCRCLPLAVMATRTGMGGFPERLGAGRTLPGQMARCFAIDFVGGDLKAAAPKGIEPVITPSNGEAKQIEISQRRAV